MVTQPLRMLLKKGTQFTRSTAYINSFNEIKKLISDAATLAFPDFSRTFWVQTNASNLVIGAVLLQQDHTNEWRPIAYISRALTNAEQNYSTTEKELLAVVWAFQKFHPYLHGTTVQVETDHQPLLSLINKSHPPGWLLRLALQEYKFTLTYRRGITNIVADSLSRIEHQASQLSIQKDEPPTHPQQIAELQQQDPTIKEIILQIQGGRKNHIHRNFIIINNILHFVSQGQPPRVYIPEVLRSSYLEFYHSSQLAGHFGFHKLLHRIRSLYYWPKIRQSISQFLKACPTCQSMKAPQQSYGTLHPIEVTEPVELVGWDLMGPFPTSIHGNKYILVIIEYLTHWCEVIALSNATTNSVACTTSTSYFSPWLPTPTFVGPRITIPQRGYSHT